MMAPQDPPPAAPALPKKDKLPLPFVAALIGAGIALLLVLPQSESTTRALTITGMALIGLGFAYLADRTLTGSFDIDVKDYLGFRAVGGIGIACLFVFIGWKISEPPPPSTPPPRVPSASTSVPIPPQRPPSLLHGVVHLQGEGELKLANAKLESSDGTCDTTITLEGSFAFTCPPNKLSVRYSGNLCGTVDVGGKGLESNQDSDITIVVVSATECRLQTVEGYQGEVRIDDVGKAELDVLLAPCEAVRTQAFGRFAFAETCSPDPSAKLQVLDKGTSLGESDVSRNRWNLVRFATKPRPGGSGGAAPIATVEVAAGGHHGQPGTTLVKCSPAQRDELAGLVKSTVGKDARLLDSYRGNTVKFRTAGAAPPSAVTLARGPQCQL